MFSIVVGFGKVPVTPIAYLRLLHFDNIFLCTSELAWCVSSQIHAPKSLKNSASRLFND